MATEKTPTTSGAAKAAAATAKKPAAPRAAASKPAAAKAATKAAPKPAAKVAPKPAAKPAVRKPAAPRAPAKPAAASAVEAAATRAVAEMRHLAEEAPVIASAVFEAVKEGLVMRKKDLIDRVVLASGAKKKSVKDIIEATLTVLGEALEKGEELILPPFGKAKVNRSRDHEGGKTMMVKLRRGNEVADERKAARKGAKEALADAED